ncbi:FAD-binding oxidoreductase [Streptomyces brevispora]|uniref:Decaprenylphospho-beta-D-ribofuranose 2-oxidase n=1 Tax=Streptomyces brevispora TaxID=887462 RepID=A0A561V0Q9_9ACTN|nr:FAD-binding oxidoreductase [Streptomyces brevispora]TWG05218.1 decaprenylphospho-beta-D-ribofuranose 2-oxidase [Streptomyces brevispora]
MSVDTVSLTGWGRTAPTTALRFRPRSYEEAAATVRGCGPRGSIARGLGRSHGDAAQNAGGSVLDMTRLNRIRAFDAGSGVVVCEAGVSLHRLMEVLLPLGWFVPVTPGSRYITVGGAIGSDVHGHNHRAAGSFSRHVTEFELLTADGEVRAVRPGTPLFDATAGGMGLTGVILSATLRFHPVKTSLMSVDTERATDLDDLLARLTAGGRRHRYESARVDLTSRGRATGRAVLTRGEHASLDTLPAHARRAPLSYFRPTQLPAAHSLVPDLVPGGLLGRTSAAALAELRYRRAPRSRTGELQRLSAFLHPLDAVPHWNRIHGHGGFVHYEFAVGHGQEETLHRIVRQISQRRCPSFLAVLRRFGASDPGLLSFPVPGWALALDLPASLPGLGRFLDGLDEEVAAAGGRVCLTNDSRLRPDVLAAMYPRLSEFRALRAELDPNGAFRSDLSRRLSL